MGMSFFKDKKIIITGAGSGIGLELIRQLYPFTHYLLAVDISGKNLDNLQNEFPEIQGFLRADLSEKNGNQVVLDWVQTHWKQVDFCFANAGKAAYGPMEFQNWKEMETLFQLNVFSPIQLGLELKKNFPNSKIRHVITCSAMAFWAIPGYSTYGASKAALLQWARTVWAEKSGDWLTLVFPIATSTSFFESAGQDIPKAFPIQHPAWVAKKTLCGVQKGKRKIFPSWVFRILLLLNNFFYVIRPLYQAIESKKFRSWITKQSKS
jgi:uncharacterized protein